jgi:hypothetical protein
MNLRFKVQGSRFRDMGKISAFEPVDREMEDENWKFETKQAKAGKNPNDENSNDQNNRTAASARLCFEFWDFGIVSHFVLRISDLSILIWRATPLNFDLALRIKLPIPA